MRASEMTRPFDRYASTLALVPVAYTCSLIAQGAVDVPWADDWFLVPTLVKAAEGQLAFSDLWAAHNDHRLVFSRLVLLGLALVTGWDVRAAMAASVVLALATLFILVRRARATALAVGGRVSPWLPLALSALVFSFAQWQNWLWHWQLQIYLAVLASIGGLAVLVSARPAWRRIALAAGCGVVATLSFASGFAFWPAAAILVCASPPDDPVPRRQQLAAWCAVTLAVVAAYLVGLERGAEGDGASEFSFVTVFPGLLAVLGAPLTPGAAVPAVAPFSLALPFAPVQVAVLLGAFALVGLPVLVRAHLRGAAPDARREILFWLALGALAVGMGGLCAAGRVASRGVEYALQPRYTTMGTHLWTAILPLLVIRGPGMSSRVGRGCVAAAALVALLSATSTALTAPLAVPWAQARALTARRLRDGDTAIIQGLVPGLPDATAAEHVATLKRLRLTCFRER